VADWESSWNTMGGMVPYWMAESLITKAVIGTTATDDDIVVYVKGHE